MNKRIIEETNVYMGIDTMQIQSKTQCPLTSKDVPYINRRITLDSASDLYSYRLNPDKADNSLIYKNTDFERVLSFMIVEMSLETPTLTRVDFRIDSFDDNYTQLLKLNRLIIMIVSQEYTMKNRYFSEDFLTLDELTVRAQNHRLELENYNKALEEPNGKVKNRLELRSKNLDGVELTAEKKDLIYNEWLKWTVRLKVKVTKPNFEKIQNTANFFLLERYNRDKQAGKSFTLNEFLYKYSCNIFTRKQLVKFAEAVGIKDPEHFAGNYKKRKKLECFSFKDLELYVQKIVQSGNLFFES